MLRTVDHVQRFLQQVVHVRAAVGYGCEQPVDGVVIGVSLDQHYRRQRQHSLQQVVAHGLADFAGVALDVQQVVDDLEGHAHVVPVPPQRLHVVLRRTAEDGPGFGGGAEQRRRLAIDALVVQPAGLRGVKGGEELDQLPAGEFHDRLRETADDANHSGIADEGGGSGEQVVSQQHRHVVAVHLVDGGLASAQAGVVHRVVVDQGSQVEQLHRRRHDERQLALVLVELCRQQGQRRPNSLAARTQGVVQERIQVGDVGLAQLV